MIVNRIAGRSMVETAPSDPAAAFIAISSGDRTARIPATLRPLIDRLASGPAALSDDDRASLEGVVDLVDATQEAVRSRALVLSAQGVPTPLINAGSTSIQPHYRSAEPVRVVTAFKPAAV